MKNRNYISKDMFYKMSQVFFEEGLLKEIYNSDKITICNVCNAFYMVFNYTITESGPIGIVLETNYMEPLLEDEGLFNQLYNYFGDKEFERRCRSLNKQVYEYFKKLKKETELKGPYINLEYEKQLIENKKSR